MAVVDVLSGRILLRYCIVCIVRTYLYGIQLHEQVQNGVVDQEIARDAKVIR